MATELPEWIRIGARVAELRGRSSDSVTITTVDRLTATQIVCGDGRRFRRDTLRLVGNHYGAQLLPVTDARVANALAMEHLRHVVSSTERRCKDLRPTAADALAALDDIEQFVKAARAAIQNPEG